MRWARFAVLGLVLAAGVGALRAQEVQVAAQADPERVEEGSSIELTLQITGTNQNPDEPPDLSQLPGFVVAAGPSVSSVFQWINGQSSASRTYSWTLIPQGQGQRSIPAIPVRIGGKVYHSSPVRVDVVPRGSLGGGAAPPPASPFADPRLRRRLAPPPTQPASLYVEAVPDRTEVYPGEQVTLEYRVASQFDIVQMSLKDQPSYQGFWVEELKTDGKYEPKAVTRKEGTFIEYTVLRKALFPTGPGTVTIPPLTFHFVVRRRGADPFESFFSPPSESIFRSTDPVTIRVRELPEAGRPPEFNGAVGRFTLKVEADRKEARVNDAVGIKVEVEGQGNISTLPAPAFPSLPDFKRYDPKVEESPRARGGTVVGNKTWNYVLIPLAAGRQVIPPIRFAFFDPGTGHYQVLEGGPLTLEVARGDPSAMAAPSASGRSEIAVLGSDIRYIKLASGPITDEGRSVYRRPGFLALLAAPLLLNAGLLAALRRRAVQGGNLALARRRKARRMARRRMARARSHLSREASVPFYQEVASALTSYLADKVGVPAAGLTYDRIDELLRRHGTAPELCTRFRRCLEGCDFARFAPGASDRGEMTRALDEAAGVIEELEGSVKVA